MSSSKPFIIAHRGANREAPENTISAFSRALELGAQGVELDVLVSKDGHFVVTHDEWLYRLTGLKEWTENLTLRELKLLDFGSHFSNKFKGEKIPRLEEVIELLKGKILINIEIKGRKIFNEGREEKLAQLIREFDLVDQVYVSSFNIFALHRMKQMAPEIRRGYLFFEKQFGLSRRGLWRYLFDPYSINLSKALAFEGLLPKFKNQGYACWVWSVNDEKEILKLCEMGAEAIITDEPAVALRVVGELVND